MANATTGTSIVAPTSATTQTVAPISLEVPSAGLFSGNATLHVAPDTATTLTGGDGRDIVVGGAGDDHLNGGEGDDVLVGGSGHNILNGGGGTDIFGHSAGAVDIITDFAPNEGERIALANGLSVSASQHETITADLGTGTTTHDALVLTISDGSAIAIVGVPDGFSQDWLVGGSGA